MARLPIPGEDGTIWGELLNEFLLVDHNPNGTLKRSGTLAGKYTKPASGIPRTHLARDVRDSLDKADALFASGTPAPARSVLATSSTSSTSLYSDARIRTAFSGTQNQVLYNAGTGVFSLSQDMHTTAAPTFSSLTLNGDAFAGAGLTMRHADGTPLQILPVYTYNKTERGFTMPSLRLTGGRFDFDTYEGKAEFRVNSTNPQFNIYSIPDNTYMLRVTMENRVVTKTNLFGDTHLEDGRGIVAGSTAGLKVGTDSAQKLGFWGATPVLQPVLPTGAGATADMVIGLLQTLGLCRQS